jgi:hypothetical protein
MLGFEEHLLPTNEKSINGNEHNIKEPYLVLAL